MPLRAKLRTLRKDAPVAVYCDSGYRANLGASIVQQEGFTDVCNVPGTWQAWDAAERNASVVVDTRMAAFGGGHVSGAFNIGGRPEVSIWAGWILNAEIPILLVLEDDEDLEPVVALFLRTGFTKFSGYLAGGMKSWVDAGFPLEQLRQVKHASELEGFRNR